MGKGPPPRDPSLRHQHRVYQILRRHYAAYTPEMVERTTGCARDVFVQTADALARNSGRERTAPSAMRWAGRTIRLVSR